MIGANTLFILGAGASVPFGLPTGQGLREQICAIGDGNGATYLTLRDDQGIQDHIIKTFASEFTRSGLQSIDAFLARRTDHETVGKLAIAACLLNMEQEWRLHYPVNGKRGTSDWYGELWNRMMDGVITPEQLVEGNHVRFVTFNYDRSLEAFLHHGVKATFNVDDEHAHEIWSKFPIRHMYGSLGDFGPANAYRYGLDSDAGFRRIAMEAAVKSIKIVPAARQEEQDQVAIRDAHWAERVLILGFSFDAINCHRLGLSEVAAARSQTLLVPKMFATRLGMSDAEAYAARSRLLKQVQGNLETGCRMLNQDTLTSLREWGVLLS